MSQTRIVIVGGGFAGLNAAKRLAKDKQVRITLIDRRNHHLFQPLLYQVAILATALMIGAIPTIFALVAFVH